ncbi:hypothetical protein BD769DRAFT_1749837 [Suillus cothurnatus]|nr:hypothetical protein BD769DRAFT_1749837 [Suillus cothurnatus]
MNRLTINPNLEQCSDFTSAIFQASHTPLLSPTVDDTQAAVILQTIWPATNAAQRVQWQQQLDSDALATAEQHHLLAEADEQCLKNCIHHIPILDQPRPSHAAATVLICDFAPRKLNKAQFVELYYWTNKGLANAKLDFHSVDNDGLVPTTAADGTTTWLPAGTTCPSSAVTADHLLAPLDFA